MAVANQYTGAGFAGDPQLAFQQLVKAQEFEQEQAALYCFNQWLRRAVDIGADDMTRQWVQLQALGKRRVDPLVEWMETCGPEMTSMAMAFNTAIKWSMVFGASGIVMIPADGIDLESPLERGGDRQVERLQVFSKWRFQPDMSMVSMDLRSPWYGQPEVWNLWPMGPWLTYIKPIRIHISRIVFMRWNSTPDTLIRYSYGFGDSCMMMWREYAIALDAAFQIVQRAGMQQTTYVFSTSELVDMAVNEATRQGLAERTAMFQRGLGQYRMAVIDKEKEELAKLTGGMEHMDDLFRIAAEAFCGATERKFTRFFGVPPKGRESAGDFDIRCHYDVIKKDFNRVVHSAIIRILDAKGWSRIKVCLRQQWQESGIESGRKWTMQGKALKDMVMSGIMSAQTALDLFMSQNGPTSGPDGIETMQWMEHKAPGVIPGKPGEDNAEDLEIERESEEDGSDG